MAKRKEETFCVRRKDADPQSTDGVDLVRGTRAQVNADLIGQHLIEPATDIELNELGAAGVKIRPALPNNATVDQE